ncbi:flagellar hook-basal body complex protein FliE [Aliikangiella sp. G2MR2-5]|uniref:flagellar hook-basal body complex protein FliE n=1 Tax=Aliikangiella sp. G2MR2-5 TaxID=2788943 RepID=UPI0018AB0AC6|nr:flagellar hook-basal body complex protein FliE [Aliikangiella sp. G2MR2-5]
MKVNVTQQQLQAQLQRLNRLAQSGANQGVNQAKSTATPGGQFGNLLTSAINTVNQYQAESAQAARQIEAGDGGTSLVKAVIASQKANVAFQATVQVRNKVVSAYQDIMNMPI